MKPNLVPVIAKPCPVDWESMIGDEKRRYCEHCQLHVHNLSAMTAAEKHAVLKPDGTRKCINYIIEPNQVVAPIGRYLTHQKWQVLKGKIAAVFVASLGLLGVSCQSPQQKPVKDPDQTISTPSTTTTEVCSPEEGGKVPRLGGVPPLPPRPLWKRLLGIY